MLANHSTNPLTARLPLVSKNVYSSKLESGNYKSLPRLNTAIQFQGMQPHERLPGVSQLLTPISPPPYGRGQSYRHQSHKSADYISKPTHRSSLPLEDILCPPEQPLPLASRSYVTPPPLGNHSQHNQSPFYSPVSQHSMPLSRVTPPLPPLTSGRSSSYPTPSVLPHQPHSHQPLTSFYQHRPQDPPPSRGSIETGSQTSGSNGSIPPPTQARLIGEQIFPGEGICWLYDDGTHIRKEIDGEAVNPQWGVTKAGKPRKRLAQACLTCREKKIKCDLADPKCIQCDKSGRECRYASARASRRPER